MPVNISLLPLSCSIFFYQLYTCCTGLFCQRRNFQNKPNSLCVRVAVLPTTALLLSDNEEQNTFLSPNNNNEDQKRKMCEMYGFTQIGDPVPDNITLKDIMDTLPKKVLPHSLYYLVASVLLQTVSQTALNQKQQCVKNQILCWRI
jgi:hypothetical protein